MRLEQRDMASYLHSLDGSQGASQADGHKASLPHPGASFADPLRFATRVEQAESQQVRAQSLCGP
jgi:hypothetical protein